MAFGDARVLVFVEVDDRDVGAFAREQHRDGAADAGVAAGDQRDLALELAAAFVVRRFEARREREVAFQAGFGEMLRRRRSIFWGSIFEDSERRLAERPVFQDSISYKEKLS